MLLSVAAAVVAAASLYLSFELGRYESGYSIFDESRRLEALDASLAEMDARNEALMRRQAILETSVNIDAETYAAVEDELVVLQGRIQELEEELAFYQGIVSPGDGVGGLRIQNIEVRNGEVDDGVLLGFLLVQAIVQNDRVAGTVRLRVSGSVGGDEAIFALEELVADGEGAEIPYRFKYFQSIEQRLFLPEGFQPEQLEIEIWPREPRGDTVTQQFAWDEVSG
jgi:hypothetical protein